MKLSTKGQQVASELAICIYNTTAGDGGKDSASQRRQ